MKKFDKASCQTSMQTAVVLGQCFLSILLRVTPPLVPLGIWLELKKVLSH